MKLFHIILKTLLSKISSSSVSEISWVIGGQTLSLILGFIILKMLSKLGTFEFGIYSLVVSVGAFFGLLLYGPLQQGFVRFYYHYEEKQESKSFVNVVDTLLLIFTFLILAISILSVLFSFFIELKKYALLFIITGIYVIAFKANELFNSILNLIRKRKENAIFQGIEKLFIIGFLLLLLLYNSLQIINVLLSLILTSTIFFSIKFIYFKDFLKNKSETSTIAINEIQKGIRKNLLKYTLPFLIWGAAGWLQLYGERWIIANFLPVSEVGIYALMLAAVNGLVIVPNNITNEFMSPIIFQQYSDLNQAEKLKTGQTYIQINLIIVFLFCIASAIITLFWGKEIIILLSDETYTRYSYLLPLLCLGTGLFLIGQAQTLLGMALNNPNKYLAPKISVSLISVILDLILINIYGLNGAACTVLIVGILYVLYIKRINKNILTNFNLKGKTNG